MKIQCDFCNKEDASVFCSADEAALCSSCDHRVHHANKLASKHHRFALLHPSTKEAPCCDICQERRAFLFCREDRAILCRDCDLSIHTANEHTTKHHRFLLTGVKLSSSPLPTNTSVLDCETPTPTEVSSNTQLPLKKKPNSVSDPPPSMMVHGTTATSTITNTSKIVDSVVPPNVGGSTSSISEYLIEMLPGWQVDDFLDSSAPFGFTSKIDFTPPFLEADLKSNLSFPSDDFGIWVPQVPQAPPALNYNNFAVQNAYNNKTSNQPNSLSVKPNKRLNDDGLTVPQISPPSSKRLRSYHPFC